MFDPIIHAQLDLHSRTKRRDPVWPIPAFNGRAPSLMRAPNPTRPVLDLAYARAYPDELVTAYPPGSANGSISHFMPNLVPAFAVRDGVIAYAGKMGDGHAMIVDHRDGWATYYADLEHMFATPTASVVSSTERVRGGQVLGYVGAPQRGQMKCLRFELWKRDDHARFDAVDPTHHLRSWALVPWTDELINTASTAIDVAA